MTKMKVLDLFSGIGGFSLGLERAGMETVAFCEIDKKAQLVLKKHWPNVPIYEDVSTLKGDEIGSVDVICGGFPCQDISTAGKGAGLAGERSGLWYEFHRLIKEIKPKYAIIENVSALRSRGLEQVLRSLAEIGYDAEWHCITASSIGAPHRRDRIWILAYPSELQCNGSNNNTGISMESEEKSKFRNSCRTETVAHSKCKWNNFRAVGRLNKFYTERPYSFFWTTEPNVGRVADGIPRRVDRLKQLGNAVVPQIPELIGRAIINYEQNRS